MRSFHAQDFIQLPSLGEAGTLTLIEELEAVAKTAPKLPSEIYASLGRLLDTCSDLQRSIAAREKAGSAADPRARAADRALDDAWGAFQSWLLGWTLLPDKAHAQVSEARALYASMFPKGLQFLTLDFKDEWNESQQRLDHITSAGLDDLITRLGGGPFLVHVARCHRAYGEALHIMSPDDGQHSQDPDEPVRQGLAEAHLALREYVAQVAATVRRAEPDSLETATTLLRPVSNRAGAEYATIDDDDETMASVHS